MSVEDHAELCVEPWLGARQPTYCFGTIAEQDRPAFEVHLVECEYCWQSVRNLDSIIHTVRFNDHVAAAAADSLPGLIGTSGALTRLWAGHHLHVMFTSVANAALYAIAVVVELAYQYERFSGTARLAGVSVFVSMLLASAVGFFVVASRARARRDDGLSYAIALTLAVALCQVAALWQVLPHTALVDATFQTYPASTAYLKSTLYFVALTLVFQLVPFHFVVRMQAEVADGRYSQAHSVLAGDRASLPPRSTPYLSPRLLSWLVVAAVGLSFLGMNYLFNNLKAGPNQGLFMTALLVRVALWAAIGVEAVAWYDHSLRELRRECLAVMALQPRRSRATRRER